MKVFPLEVRDETIRFILYLVHYLRDGTVRHDKIIERIRIEVKEINGSLADFLNTQELNEIRERCKVKSRAVDRAKNWLEVARTNPDINGYAVKKAASTLKEAGLKPTHIGLSEEDFQGAAL